jgi:hypothetical protein
MAPMAVLPVAVAAAEPTAAASFAERMEFSQTVRQWIPSLGVALLLLEWACSRSSLRPRVETVVNLALAILVLATLFAWWHPYRGELRAWLHEKDAFHYYVGGKYFDELGYERLYACSVVADAEDGFAAALAGTQIRDLVRNEPQPAAEALRNPHACKRHFSPARWEAFRRDVAYFRSRSGPVQWRLARGDHGYNPPPTWTLLGGLLASTGPARDSQLAWLSGVDPLLVFGLFAGLAWGFGWRVACLGFLFWGTNQMATWEWVGGSLLRYDWLAASILGLCCLRRGRPAAAGLLIAWAAGVRIFPLAIAGGVALAALLSVRREGRRFIDPAHATFAASLLAGLVLIGVLSSVVVGLTSWVGFFENSRTHLATDSVNRVGLKPLLSYAAESRLGETLEPRAWDAFAQWRAAREAVFDARFIWFCALVLAQLALVALASRRVPDAFAGALGVAMIPVLVSLGSYYMGILVAFAPLAGRYRDVGIALLLLASASWWGGRWGGPDRDAVSALWSFEILLFVNYCAARVFARNRSR